MPGGPIIIIDPKTQRADIYYSPEEAAARYRELADELDSNPVDESEDEQS